MSAAYHHPEFADAEAAFEKASNGSTAPMTAATAIKPRRTTWMWFPYLPAGMISIIGAKGGSCKGLTCTSLAATVSTGGTWPDGTGPAKPGAVLWCEAEDPLPEVVVPRLIAAKADRSQKSPSPPATPSPPSRTLRDYVQKNGVKLIVLSPMISFLQLSDITLELGVREVLEKTTQASIEGTDCALVGIAHSNKKADLSAIERILGAVAFTNFVRSVLLTAPEDLDEGAYRLVHAKHNLSTKGDDLILRPVYVGDDPGHRDQYVRLEWTQPGKWRRQCKRHLRPQEGRQRGPSARDWLRKLPPRARRDAAR